MITEIRTVDKEISLRWEQWKHYHLMHSIWSIA